MDNVGWICVPYPGLWPTRKRAHRNISYSSPNWLVYGKSGIAILPPRRMHREIVRPFTIIASELNRSKSSNNSWAFTQGRRILDLKGVCGIGES